MASNIIPSLQPLSVDIKSIKPDPRNARKHPPRNLETIKRSLETYGQRKPIVVNARTNIIEAGNALWESAKALGWDRIAVVKVDDSKEMATGYGIMDNQSALLAEWDLPVLKDILEELDTGAWDMALTGFLGSEIEDLMSQFYVPKEGLTDDNELPEKVETICKTGDLWQLGSHKLLCGDATKREDVEKLMGGEKADLVFTDPPYGLGKDIEKDELIYQDDLSRDFNKIIWQFIKDNSLLLVFMSPRTINFWIKNVDFYTTILWTTKNWTKANYLCFFESGQAILVFGKGYRKWSSLKCRDTFALVNTDRRIHEIGFNAVELKKGINIKYSVHPTMKPIFVLTEIISCVIPENQIVLDPFGGSGSTMIAAEKLGRRCFMMEIDKHYCGVIIQRWQNFTGKQAVKL